MAFFTYVRYYFFVIPKADFVKFPYLHFFLEFFYSPEGLQSLLVSVSYHPLLVLY